MDITLTLHIDDEAGPTWGQLMQVLNYSTPANGQLVIAPDQGPFLITAGGIGVNGVLTMTDRLAEAEEKITSALAELNRDRALYTTPEDDLSDRVYDARRILEGKI
jgi:ferredoxin-NADP reductase